MKQLFYFAAAVATAVILAACGGRSDNDKDDEQTQDYTSFVITSKKTKDTLYSVLSGYFDAAGYCWKIAEHGTLLPGGITPETVLDIDVDSIYFYFNENGVDCGTYMPLVVRKKKGNNFTIDDATIVNILMTDGKVDSTYYPQ